MTYPEYIEVKEYRDRLLKLLEAGKRTLPANGFALFSECMQGNLRRLEKEMSVFEKSSCGSMCSWLGLRTFNVTAQIDARTQEAENNVLWNSPVRKASTLPAVIGASQPSLLPADEESVLLRPEPLPA